MFDYKNITELDLLIGQSLARIQNAMVKCSVIFGTHENKKAIKRILDQKWTEALEVPQRLILAYGVKKSIAFDFDFRLKLAYAIQLIGDIGALGLYDCLPFFERLEACDTTDKLAELGHDLESVLQSGYGHMRREAIKELGIGIKK
jgi:hypothetical protein